VIWDTLRLLNWRDCRGCPGQVFARLYEGEPARAAG
jgi:hypothetical protein